MVLVLAAVVLAVLLLLALLLSLRSGTTDAVAADRSEKLPVGAEAAIWSILEAVPDPRNHLALTRDLTGEVRITGTPLDPAHRTGESPLVTVPASPWEPVDRPDERVEAPDDTRVAALHHAS
jgi:hypothetical protein